MPDRISPPADDAAGAWGSLRSAKLAMDACRPRPPPRAGSLRRCCRRHAPDVFPFEHVQPGREWALRPRRPRMLNSAWA